MDPELPTAEAMADSCATFSTESSVPGSAHLLSARASRTALLAMVPSWVWFGTEARFQRVGQLTQFTWNEDVLKLPGSISTVARRPWTLA